MTLYESSTICSRGEKQSSIIPYHSETSFVLILNQAEILQESTEQYLIKPDVKTFNKYKQIKPNPVCKDLYSITMCNFSLSKLSLVKENRQMESTHWENAMKHVSWQKQMVKQM